MKRILPLVLSLFLVIGLYAQSSNFATKIFDMSVIQDNDDRRTEKKVAFTKGLELEVSSHFVSIPTFGDSRGATGWRINGGLKYYIDKESTGGVVLVELNYQRVGEYGFFADHRIDDFNFVKAFGGTAGFGTSIDAIDLIVAASLLKTVGDNVASENTIIELGIIGAIDIIKVFGFDLGVRADFMYQSSGPTTIQNRDVSNFPFRVSGGINLTYTL